LTAGNQQDLIDQDSKNARTARSIYRALAWIFAACVLIQVFLVGMDLFGATHDPALHRNFAYIYGWLVPVMLLLARIGKLPSRLVALTVLLLVLYAVQTVLPGFTKQFPFLGPLHVVNAFVLFGLGLILGQRAGRLVGSPPLQENTE
jgi:uncharacterized membrane protein